MRKWTLFALGWALILGGSLLAHLIQTSSGVRVSEVRYPGEAGTTMAGLLYTPPNATPRTPAPAVLASHGYINTREMQSAFAIELARRGVVVLAMDMTGHGYSQAAVGEQGLGGPAALRYLRGLPFVDKANIGLEGHSLGGAPVQIAAKAFPDGYRSLVLEGSTPGFLGAADATTTFPRNLAIVYGQYDEFSELMWQVAKGSLLPGSPRLQKTFGATGPVQPGRLYGSIAAGAGRMLYLPPITHPMEHFSSAGVGAAVDWFQRTLSGVAPLPASNQIWLWKEIGTAIGFAGFVTLLLGTFHLLLATRPFASLNKAGEPRLERRDGRWWLAFLLTAILPAASFFPFMKLGGLFFPMRLFPQYITNQLVVWALLNAGLILIVNAVLRGPKARFDNRWLASAAIAVATVAVGYLSLLLVEALFQVDYRFWVLGLKPLDARHFGYFLAYLPLWTGFFLVAIRALNANLAVATERARTQAIVAAIAMSAGFVVMLKLQYISLWASGRLLLPQEPLNTIVAIQFVPLLAVIGVIGAFTWRRTNSYAPGAFICALVITWYVVAGTATHWSPQFKLPQPAAATKG